MALIKDHHDPQLTVAQLEQCVHYCEASCIASIEAGLYFVDVTGQELSPDFLQRLGTSIEICKLSPDFLLARDVEMQRQISEICADACVNCAEACLQLDPYDPFLQECAAMCQSYSQRCLERAAMLQGNPQPTLPQRADSSVLM